MEVGRRNLISGNERRNGSKRWKKLGNLPLALFLSFNDRDVHPKCPSASNPYHKCGRHCLEKIPSRKDFVDAVKTDGDRLLEKNSVRAGVNPNCPNASNPYHKCADYCMKKLAGKRWGADEDQEQKNRLENAGVNPNCPHASNPYHKCVENCLEKLPVKYGYQERENNLEKTGVNLNCPHASNPYHKCAAYCLEKFPVKYVDQEQKNRLEKAGVNPNCPHASNPYHKCVENCLEKLPVKYGFQERVNNLEKTGVNLNCPHASNPYHKCAAYCLEKLPVKYGYQERKKNLEKIGVNPNCPNASNPYHKCAEYCLEKLPAKHHYAGKDQLDGDQECKNFEKIGVNPNCPNASNPYHKCTESCMENMPVKHQYAGKDQLDGDQGCEKYLEKMGVNQNCPNSSNPYHKCDDYCLEDLPTKDQELKMKLKKTGVNPNCLNASNPYHKCAEYCLEKFPTKRQNGNHEQEEKMEKIGVNPNCPNVSNPYHKCTEYCLQKMSAKSQYASKNQLEKPMGVSHKTNKCSVHLNSNASSPINSVTEDTFIREYLNKDLKPKNENEIDITTQGGFNYELTNASNPCNASAEYSFQSVPKGEQHGQEKSERDLFGIDRSVTLPSRKLALNSCKANERVHPNGALNPKEERLLFVACRTVDFECKYASNPYHVCAEYCFQDHPIKDQIWEAFMKSKKNKRVAPLQEAVNLQCKNESNPCHICAKYCFENGANRNLLKQTIMNLKEEDTVVHPSLRRASPECRFASNPDHVCAAYCFKNDTESKQRGKVMKLDSPKELKSSVSDTGCNYASDPYHECNKYSFNKKTPGSGILDTGAMRTNERKEEICYAHVGDVISNSQISSALFHSSEEGSFSAEEDITAKVEDRNPSLKDKINHPIRAKISLEASKSSHNKRMEPSVGRAMQDGRKRSSLNSRHVENKQHVTEDLQSAGTEEIVMNTEESTDVQQPLHSLGASDLFQKWLKNCSHSSFSKDEITEVEK